LAAPADPADAAPQA